MSTILEMYRVDDYDNWHAAEAAGAVYSTVIHSVDEHQHGAGAYIVDDVVRAVLCAVQMMDGTQLIQYRVKGA